MALKTILDLLSLAHQRKLKEEMGENRTVLAFDYYFIHMFLHENLGAASQRAEEM